MRSQTGFPQGKPVFLDKSMVHFYNKNIVGMYAALRNTPAKSHRKEEITVAAKQVVLTDTGLKKLEEELEELKTSKRQEIAEKIKVARSFGDLSENSEYDEAKNEQAVVEARIATIEATLKNVKIIDESEITTEVVSMGTTVRVFDEDMDEEVEYSIVGSSESDPRNGKISDESPVGKALVGHRVGETVVAETPGGELSFKILAISK